MREEKNLSQRELGRRLGVHHNFVSSAEMGDRALLYTEVRAWCVALEISWVDFTQHLDDLLAAQDELLASQDAAEATDAEGTNAQGTNAAKEHNHGGD